MAFYGIMRMEKRKAKDLGGLQIEHQRTTADSGKNFARSDIDWNKTADNITFIHNSNWAKAVKERAAADGFKIRQGTKEAARASVVALDTLYTASPEWFKNKTPDEVEQYFRDCLAWHVETYCQGDRSRVLSAVVHLDEQTPHMHVVSIPLIREGEKVRLSAKDLCGGPTQYRQRQQSFFDKVSSRYGLERGEIRDGEEKKQHLSVQDYKIDQNKAALQKQGRTLQKQEKQVAALKQERQIVSSVDVLRTQEKFHLFGRSVIKSDELQALKHTAAFVNKTEEQIADVAAEKARNKQTKRELDKQAEGIDKAQEKASAAITEAQERAAALDEREDNLREREFNVAHIVEQREEAFRDTLGDCRDRISDQQEEIDELRRQVSALQQIHDIESRLYDNREHQTQKMRQQYRDLCEFAEVEPIQTDREQEQLQQRQSRGLSR